MIPTAIKVILKTQFSYFNVILVDQDHYFYANGNNGGKNYMLCFDGPNTKEFKLLG